MDLIKKRMKNQEERREEEKRVKKEVKQMSEDLRQNMSKEIINNIFKVNLKYFRSIERGTEDSWRHRLFLSQNNKTGNQNKLFQKMIAAPFSDAQQYLVYEQVKKVWLKDKNMQIENDR